MGCQSKKSSQTRGHVESGNEFFPSIIVVLVFSFFGCSLGIVTDARLRAGFSQRRKLDV